MSTMARPNARPFPIGSLLALTSPFAQSLRRERLGRSLEALGSIVAAGGAIRKDEHLAGINDDFVGGEAVGGHQRVEIDPLAGGDAVEAVPGLDGVAAAGGR